ncbi:MAG: tRNA pseudouridine(13) synthase TruD [Candidatus Bathyarchaeota archaeon]|nr:tRNA pseudouridine(13) synthase TruD [Candidatus Bathyarchaeota archaeon]
MATRVPKIESDFGIEVYASRSRGIGGRIRGFPEDFVVEEILTDGSKASVESTDITALTSGHGRYLVCVLIKKGWDTFAAVRQIAKQIGVSPDRIDIAGIKDARALTAQHMSVGGIPLQRVLKVDLPRLNVIPVRFSSEKISSKILFGNQFNITVRSIEWNSATAHRRIEKTRNELSDLGGVPNFFGHQRFGTVRSTTHRIGHCLVKESFEEAALVFLSEPSRHEHPQARGARERLRETGDYRLALKFFPRRLSYERQMLAHLSRYPKDFLGAFRRLPLKLRRFFVQAYESYLFNLFLSERIKREIPIGKAHNGDCIVSLDEKGLPTNILKKAGPRSISEINKRIGEGKMAVAIPLIGFKQPPSEGVQGEIEGEILEREAIRPRDFRIQRMLEASAAGGLRVSLTPILNLDIEEEDELADRGGLSVKFSFTLHKGSYATVLLREFMKSRDLIKAGF